MISGYVERIVYRNDDNAYSVLEVSSKGEEVILVGTFPYIEEGAFIEADGVMKLHPVYGEQLAVEHYEIKEPDNTASIEKYLASGAIKGIGKAMAAKIVRRFGDDTMRIMEEEPERLAEIKGISERMAMEISAQVEEKKDLRDAMMFLSGYGISMNLALKIYKFYGSAIYTIITENPYKLADDVTGIGFKIADAIAGKVGIKADSEYRIKCGILYVLSQASLDGHTYLPDEELFRACYNLLGLSQEDISMREMLLDLQLDKKVIIKPDGECNQVYAASAYYTELNTARMLHDIDKAIPVKIITGGPGTGKTTNIKRLIDEYESEGLEVVLAAPTGRAAKRMSEMTGHAASTIHRLLGAGVEENHFEKDESNPIEADVIIVDEMSMVDIYLFCALLRAVSCGTRMILVGDTNQLPSVGPGNVLRDIIASDCFDVMRLTKIYRQDEDSDIIINAHKMIDEEPIDLEKRSRDFLFIKRDEPDAIISAMVTLLSKKLPQYVNAGADKIQVMSPMHKGALGVERLNTILQEYMNPKSAGKCEKEIEKTLWREGDKVMQIRNNYEKNVFNGDIGIIREINLFAETMTVVFDDDREVEYDFAEVCDLELAYAITIHKSQGSEYPAVIIPVFDGPRMLLTRNLIYTAVTRARGCVVLVGLPECFHAMTANTQELRRYSGLEARIEEIYKDIT